MTDAITFDPEIALSPDHQMTLTGTANPFVSKIEIFNDSGKDLGSAQISDGTWSFTQDIGTTTGGEKFAAKVTDDIGKTTSVSGDTVITNNIKGNPFTSLEVQIGPGLGFETYSSQGTLEYQGKITGSSDHSIVTETGDHTHTQFVFLQASNSDSIVQKITNFHVDGNSHDTVLLPHADFANMADLLRNTTMSGGNALIHDPNNGATLTLMGVTKTEMKAHPHDFAFHGTGQLTSSS